MKPYRNCSLEPVSLEQRAALSRAIDSVHLDEVDIQKCRCFENDESFCADIGGMHKFE
jgi:hypothetical protein